MQAAQWVDQLLWFGKSDCERVHREIPELQIGLDVRGPQACEIKRCLRGEYDARRIALIVKYEACRSGFIGKPARQGDRALLDREIQIRLFEVKEVIAQRPTDQPDASSVGQRLDAMG